MTAPTWFDAEKTRQIVDAQKRVKELGNDALLKEYATTTDTMFVNPAALEIRRRHLKMPRRRP